MPSHSKEIKLRAFKIEDETLTRPGSGLLNLLQTVLTEESTAQSRRMKLNEQDSDEDLLSYFVWRQSDYVFGMMLRIIPAENGGLIDNDLFNQPKIKLTDLETGPSNQRQYKDHYYFCLNNRFLITNLSGIYSIDRFQTYLNWLLRDLRSNIIEIDPVTKVPQGVRVSDINCIEFGNGAVVRAAVNNSVNAVTTKLQEVSQSLLSYLMNDTDSLSEISEEELVSAKLLLKIKKKPREMAEVDYNRIMGAVTRQITNDSGITIKTKQGVNFSGEAVKLVRDVDVELTDAGRIVEEQLKQRMEIFLHDLVSEANE